MGPRQGRQSGGCVPGGGGGGEIPLIFQGINKECKCFVALRLDLKSRSSSMGEAELRAGRTSKRPTALSLHDHQQKTFFFFFPFPYLEATGAWRFICSKGKPWRHLLWHDPFHTRLPLWVVQSVAVPDHAGLHFEGDKRAGPRQGTERHRDRKGYEMGRV